MTTPSGRGPSKPEDKTKQLPSEMDLQLRRIKAHNFRGLGDLDAAIPKGKNIVCLVGPNGCGKSSLMSLMIKALRQLMSQSAEDEPEALAPSSPITPYRALSSDEAGSRGDHFGVRLDWAWADKTYTHLTMVRSQAGKSFIDFANEELGVKLKTSLVRQNLKGVRSERFRMDWEELPKEDPLPRSVVLERPVGRFEIPYYEEAPEKAVFSRPLPYRENFRPLRIRAISGVDRLESLLMDLLFDAQLHQDRRTDSIAQIGILKISKAYERLRNSQMAGASLFRVGEWPLRRIGLGGLAALSLLSAGELDILVTVGEIITQQSYINRIHNWNGYSEPSGVVFIDEVDAHLHPAWQEKVLQLYVELFPNIQFIVSTHSPFVLRSLPREQSIVLRLPDGVTFNEDFTAWNIENILSMVFNVEGHWSQIIRQKLEEMELAAATPGEEQQLIDLYFELAHRNSSLRAECLRILAVYCSVETRDRIRELELSKQSVKQK